MIFLPKTLVFFSSAYVAFKVYCLELLVNCGLYVFFLINMIVNLPVQTLYPVFFFFFFF